MVQVTGNEYISLPSINEINGEVDYITMLHMNSNGMLQLTGNPFISILVTIDGKETSLDGKLQWNRINYWIPQASFIINDINIVIDYLCPINMKAFMLHFEIINESKERKNIEIKINLNWEKTFHVVNENFEIDSPIKSKESNWNHGTVYYQTIGIPLIAVSQMNDRFCENIYSKETYSFDSYFGFGMEEVSCSTASKNLKRVGYNNLINDTKNFLAKKIITHTDSKVMEILNTNLFFSYFYSIGFTIDTEELVLVTSRSPRYYVSSAYWDRDSLLWSFPSIMLCDEKIAKKALNYVFNKQIKNIGEHSRFINGTILEPGFELDELCAPVLALYNYIEKSKDENILNDKKIVEGLFLILEKLKSKRHDKIALYETFLMPTDDFNEEKYLTYDNVLVWKILFILSDYLNMPELKTEAENVKTAILKYCVKNDIFIWSTDLKTNYSIYDEPPGSLLLLPYYGFCSYENRIWKNTADLIRSKEYRLSFADKNISEIGCEHAPHPWVLSLCNSLLSGYEKTAIENLKKMKLDNGIACESVDENSGICTTGEAFATCAGFLSYALYFKISNNKK